MTGWSGRTSPDDHAKSHAKNDIDLRRALIIGNSGSGKSWLAERIANRLGSTLIDLDLIHWLAGGYKVARELEEAIRLTRQAADGDSWVIEGIYGWLAHEVLASATSLIWLCLDEANCVANIHQRGVRRNGNTESFDALLRWAVSYRARMGSSSYTAHEAMFNDYAGTKTALRSREAITAFVRLLPN